MQPAEREYVCLINVNDNKIRKLIQCVSRILLFLNPCILSDRTFQLVSTIYVL